MSDAAAKDRPPRFAERQYPLRRRREGVAARYDAAQTTDDNRRHWAAADGLSPDALANPAVRQVLRNRARYEFHNGSHCKGIAETLANDAVGTGPELQLLVKDKALARDVQDEFWAWDQEVGLGDLLWQVRLGRVHSGEAFGVLGTNPALAGDVKLDVRLVEPEQVVDPFLPAGVAADSVDGIEFDRYGNPAFYNVLRYHPGGTSMAGLYLPTEFDRYAARYVLHYYKRDRPGQRRGVPDITPALPLFAELRRYTAAVIAAAETAADFAGVMQTDGLPGAEADDPGPDESAFDQIEIVKRMLLTLPRGYKLGQIKAEQPVTGYAEFVDAKLAEIARCLNMPFSIAALSSAKANMSASYLDGQRYANAVTIDRGRIERLLNRLLDEWLNEWSRLRPSRAAAIPVGPVPRAWRWPSLSHHADPAKVANADATALGSGMASIPRLYARDGLDWEAEQAAAAEAFGVTVDEYRKLLREKVIGNPNAAAAAGGKPDPANEDA